jgi:predicted lipoprotein with Yx(FWY)xxD motif
VDTLFLVYVFFGPLIGLALALAAFGTSPRRAAVRSLCGVLALAGMVVARWIFADTDPDSTACGEECVDYWGHYFSP